MLIVDFHTHVFPDNIAYKTVKKMSENADISLFADGTISGLLKTMDKFQVNYSVTLPVATKPDQVTSINNWTENNRDPRIIAFGAIHPDFEDVGGELKRIKDLGIKGIKLHPDYQEFYPNEEKMDAVYRACADLGLIILFHSGDDLGYPRPGHSLPRIMAKAVDAHPGQTFVFAHMGGFEMWDQVEKFLIGRDVYLDTSFSFGYMPPERIESMIRKHGPERILLGSDSPWGDISENIRGVMKLNLTDKEKEMILGKNALELLGLEG